MKRRLTLLALLVPLPALAAPYNPNASTGLSAATSSDAGAGLTQSQFLLGDMGGLRKALSADGIDLTIVETSEIFGNVTGGTRQGFEYDGLATATLGLDTERAFGWHGGSFNVSALQIHGRNVSADNLDTLQTSSGIESERATRLWELWYQQKFLDDDKLDLKIGQQSLDNEFMVSPNSLNFANTMMGWPMLPSADMPSGGPAYPMASLGVRARYRITPAVTVLGGVFTANPGGDHAADAQVTNPSGILFPLPGRTLAIGEIQYAYPSLGTLVYAGQNEPLAHVYRLGAWHEGATTGLYGVADQMLWRDNDDADRTIEAFGRFMGTPNDGTNPVQFSANFGVVMHEPIVNRDDDTIGLGFGTTKAAPNVVAAARTQAALTNGLDPVRGDESFVELTYSASITQWLSVQPDFQYVIFPGAGVENPNAPGTRVGNEAIFGLRTNILF
jgi:porin